MNPRISRRKFFGASAQTSVALLGLGTLANFARAIEPFQRSGKPRFPLSLAAYSFREFFREGAVPHMDFFEFIDFCAEQGCQGTELTSYYFPNQVTDEFLLQVRRHCFLRGIAISGTAVGNNFAMPKGEKLSAQILSVKQWIDRASILGAPHIRVFAGGAAKGLTAAEARKMCIVSLEECCEYAGKKGIFLGLENHGGIVAEADGLLEIVNAVKSPWLGINLDTGNFHTADPYGDLAKCAPYAVNVQVKAVIRPLNSKESQPVDIARIFKILRKINYQGYVALEYESEEDPWTRIPVLLKEMKKQAA